MEVIRKDDVKSSHPESANTPEYFWWNCIYMQVLWEMIHLQGRQHWKKCFSLPCQMGSTGTPKGRIFSWGGISFKFTLSVGARLTEKPTSGHESCLPLKKGQNVACVSIPLKLPKYFNCHYAIITLVSKWVSKIILKLKNIFTETVSVATQKFSAKSSNVLADTLNIMLKMTFFKFEQVGHSH